jgi:CheY-like chemotaxis protein
VSALNMLGPARLDEARFARHRSTCERQAGNLVRLVDDLLDVARITRGKVELRKQRLDLVAAAESAIVSHRPFLESRRHTLSFTFDPEVFTVEADPTRLEQIVGNLLHNAAKYTDPGGHLTVRIERAVEEERPWAALSVSDTGRGIPAPMLDAVFDLFTQVDTSMDRGLGGLGIGLTLVRRLVELHGGAVVAQSAGLGQGSTFRLRLPLLAPTGAEEAERRGGPVGLGALAPGASQRVLLVEDNEDLRETLREILEHLGLTVEVAADGTSGLAMLLDRRPDVALVDIGLPDLDGYEIARKARAARGGSDLYLVALTGYGGAEAQSKAKQAGFDRHLVKPLNLNELSGVISRTGA